MVGDGSGREKPLLSNEFEFSFRSTNRFPSMSREEENRSSSSRFDYPIYRGQLSILNEKTNEWINGEIERDFQWTCTSLTIQWNGHQIRMTSNRFRDEENEVLAEIFIREGSGFWSEKYDFKVLANKYPEEIYLLALAPQDLSTSSN